MFADIRLAMKPYFLSSDPNIANIGRALAISLALHAALIAWGHLLLATPAARTAKALRVRLVDAVLPAPAATPLALPQPELLMPEDTPRKAAATPPRKTRPREVRSPKPAAPRLARPAEAPQQADMRAGPPMLAGEAARKAGAQIARQLLYPPEAIARGLEGEALVLLFLDESGNAIAARIEASSGHAILDEAAVRAARTLRSLPSGAPREAVLPVRFRLR